MEKRGRGEKLEKFEKLNMVENLLLSALFFIIMQKQARIKKKKKLSAIIGLEIVASMPIE